MLILCRSKFWRSLGNDEALDENLKESLFEEYVQHALPSLLAALQTLLRMQL